MIAPGAGGLRTASVASRNGPVSGGTVRLCGGAGSKQRNSGAVQ